MIITQEQKDKLIVENVTDSLKGITKVFTVINPATGEMWYQTK